MSAVHPVTAIDDARPRPILTPEGVLLEFQLATLGERATAFCADVFLMLFAIVAVWIGAQLAGTVSALGGWLIAFAYLSAFLLRHFYFVGCELHWGGRTLGKQKVGIRVIDARGGPLGADAVFVRNLTRDLEIAVPLLVLASPKLMAEGLDGWVQLGALTWILAFALVPFLNRDRMRIGDLLAGTIVVRDPRAALLPDLVATGLKRRPQPSVPGAAQAPEFAFSPQQLAMYGIRELEVLADLLRRSDEHARGDFEVVCDKVKRKIAWDPQRWAVDPERFLRAFYPALRAHLEHKMLLGDRQEQKKLGRLRRQP